jgi:hypothetical protein
MLSSTLTRGAIFLTLWSAPGFAAVTVGDPVDGSTTSSSVLIRAHNTGCNGLAPTSLVYTIDNGREAPGETPYDVDVMSQPLTPGIHTIQFKSATHFEECPTVITTIRVADPKNASEVAAAAIGSIPSNAKSSGDLETRGWSEQHDGGTPGGSRGSTSYPETLDGYDNVRKFYATYTERAGERWSTEVAVDQSATHFVLDTYVYFPNPSQVLNLETDIDAVDSSGDTYILSTQCAGSVDGWEYGYTEGKHDHWQDIHVGCNPANWTPNTWHHIQIGEYRGTNGTVTHEYAALDGKTVSFNNDTRESSHYLGWEKGIINVQFQIEGSSEGSGSFTAYIHKFTVYRW